MADKRRVSYVLKFVALCWAAIAVLAGTVVALAHLLNDTTLTIIVFQVVIYSCLFGFLGWQQYKWKSERKRWHLGKNKGSWGGLNGSERDDTEESDNGWK